jgi:hypothetical protein
MARLVRVVAREEVDTSVQPYVGNCVESETVPGEQSLPEPLTLPDRDNSLPLSSRSNREEAHPRETLRMNSGVIIPATAVVGHSLVFLFSLAATAYFIGGFMVMPRSPDMLKVVVYASLLSIFMPLTLFSLDWLKASVNKMAYGAEDVVTMPHWVGNASRAKSLIWNAILTCSAVYLVLAGISFYRAFLSTSGTPRGNPFSGWFVIAVAIYCLAVYFDLKKANADQPETRL